MQIGYTELFAMDLATNKRRNGSTNAFLVSEVAVCYLQIRKKIPWIVASEHTKIRMGGVMRIYGECAEVKMVCFTASALVFFFRVLIGAWGKYPILFFRPRAVFPCRPCPYRIAFLWKHGISRCRRADSGYGRLRPRSSRCARRRERNCALLRRA